MPNIGRIHVNQVKCSESPYVSSGSLVEVDTYCAVELVFIYLSNLLYILMLHYMAKSIWTAMVGLDLIVQARSP